MALNPGLRARGDEGQTTVEYMLMLAAVVSIYVMLAAGLTRIGLMKKLMQPLTGDFAHAYQFGHPKALGPDEGGPVNHPRFIGGENNFRIFINPEVGGGDGGGV